MWNNKELVEMAKKVMRTLREEVEEEDLKLSVIENEKAGKSKMIASCDHLEENFRECSKEEGVTEADSVATLQSRGCEPKKKRQERNAGEDSRLSRK